MKQRKKPRLNKKGWFKGALFMIQKLRRLESLTKGSKLTGDDVEELGAKIKRVIAKVHG